MNQFVMTENGRDVAFTITSARIAFNGKGEDGTCKIEVTASHPEIPDDAVLWFASVKGRRDSDFSFQAEVIDWTDAATHPSKAGFYLYEHSALEDVNLEVRQEAERWRLELTCALLSMGWDPNKIRASTDLELSDDFELQIG
jgi:hypothetical protein